MLYINLDLSALKDFDNLGETTKNQLQKAANNLVIATNAKAKELANERLHSRRGQFLDALSNFQLDENTWIVNLDSSAEWINDGQEERDMLPDLLKSKKAKRAKDGSTFLIIPFNQNKGKGSMTPAQNSLLATIKTELKKVGATPTGIENDKLGKPKTGLVRSLDILNKPISTSGNRIGAGPSGQVSQGRTGGTSLLKGIRIYQKQVQGAGGESKTVRAIMTFRVASSKQQGSGKWHHPGVKPTNIMEDAYKWALEQWSTKIAPGIIDSIKANF